MTPKGVALLLVLAVWVMVIGSMFIAYRATEPQKQPYKICSPTCP